MAERFSTATRLRALGSQAAARVYRAQSRRLRRPPRRSRLTGRAALLALVVCGLVPPQLFALVDTEELLRAEPQLARTMGLVAARPGSLTPIAQEELAPGPLDEALAQAVVDVSGRPYCVHTGEPPGQEYALIGGGTAPSGQGGVPYTGSLTRHVFETLAFHAHLCLHVTVVAGRDPHHIVEAQFKAVARALRDAIALAPRVDGVPSTKGAL